MLASGATLPSNNSLIEKWCFNNDTAICATDGGLYTWAEANQLIPSCNTTSCTPSTPSQGICPSGWHIPTSNEIKTLEVYLGMCTGAGADCVDATGYRGTALGIGTKLKSGGSSGFNLIYAGYKDGGNNLFNQRGGHGALQSATQWSATGASGRDVYTAQTGVLIGGWVNSGVKTYGWSVRCLAN